MKNLFQRTYFGLTVAFMMAASASAQTTVSFGVTSAGPTNNSLAGVYTDPYQGCVGCTTSGGGTPLQIFCDDFTDDVTPPEYWTAFATSLTAIPAVPSTVYYTGSTSYSFSPTPAASYSATTDYIAASYLALQSLLVGNATPAAQQQQSELSFALWGIFDPTLLNSIANASYYDESNPMTATQLANEQSDLLNALSVAQSAGTAANFEAANNISNVTIYSAVCAATSAGVPPSACTPGGLWSPATSGRPQEFLTVTMTEPSTPAVLAFYLVGVSVIGFFFRRRKAAMRS